MIQNNGIHWIDSCKINLDLGGGSYILDIFTNIDFKDDCLVLNWFWFLLEICLNLLYICYWANLASHKGALACYPGTLLLIFFFENSMDTYATSDYIHAWCDSWVFKYILDLLRSDTYGVIDFYTNLLCFMKALEKPFRYALRFSLMVGFLVWHVIFWNHLAYLGIHK